MPDNFTANREAIRARTRYDLPMDDWLQVPERRKGIPVWRLCLLMAVTFLLIWIGKPLFFGG